jgi:hypothetical protein
MIVSANMLYSELLKVRPDLPLDCENLSIEQHLGSFRISATLKDGTVVERTLTLEEAERAFGDGVSAA